MAILSLANDVLKYLQLSADDSYGNVARVQAGAEALIKRATGRTLETASFKEVFRRNDTSSLWLKETPVTAVTKIAVGERNAATISNSNAATAAIVRVTSTGVGLSLDGAAESLLLFATYATLSTLSTAVNALGSGWSMTVDSIYGAIKSTELIAMFGKEAIAGASVNLRIPAKALASYELNADTGEISRWWDFYSNWEIDDRSQLTERLSDIGAYDLWWRAGGGALIYVNYTAGYASADVPDDLKQGILDLIQFNYDRLKEGAVGLDSYSVAGLSKKFLEMPASTKHAIATYRRIRL